MSEPAADIDALRAGVLDYAQAFSNALKLHTPKASKTGCPTCKTPWPCPTTTALIAPRNNQTPP